MAPERTAEETVAILARLTAPFNLTDVQWRVTSTSKDKTKGMVAPYADPRAYHNRLNEVLTAAGWSCKYTMTTINGITRSKGGKDVATGKITAIATVEIFGISEKSSMGEMWADDENAVTRAEAQAFKRACSMFGIGQYFYDLKALGSQLWVPLDERGNPRTIPKLPAWAVPAGQKVSGPQSSQAKAAPTTVARAEQKPATVEPSAAKDRFDAERKNFEKALGLPLFANILDLINKMEAEGKLTESKYSVALRKMSECISTLEQIGVLASEMPVGALDAMLDRFQIKRLDLIPTHRALYGLAREMGVVSHQQQKAA